MSESPAQPEPFSELEGLLLACLDRPEAERDTALTSLCKQHPEHAEALRRRFAMLSELGFVGVRHAALEPDAAFGDYKLLRRLGSGAMGVVYLAEQLSTRRRVALKVLRPEYLEEPRARERFRRELEAAAGLDHPGICPVYDAGEVEGRPFLAMRYLEGESLAAAIGATQRARAGPTLAMPPDQGREGPKSPAHNRQRIEAVTSLVEGSRPRPARSARAGSGPSRRQAGQHHAARYRRSRAGRLRTRP